MFSLFEKERFICLGVNPKAEWTRMDSIMTPLLLHEHLKTKSYTKEEIKNLQKQLNEIGIPYSDLFVEFNWIPEKKASNFITERTSFPKIISGVRKEFENSLVHNEMYEKFIAPAIIKNLNLDLIGEYNIDEVRDIFFDKGVIVPHHFDHYLISFSIIKDNKSGNIIHNIKILKKQEGYNLEPNEYEKTEAILDRIVNKINQEDYNIEMDEDELFSHLENGSRLKGGFLELKCYYVLGISYFETGNVERAEKLFQKMINIDSDISKLTVAKEFIRPIGEIYEEKKDFLNALFWYKKAVELSPTIGLKKKISSLDKLINN